MPAVAELKITPADRHKIWGELMTSKNPKNTLRKILIPDRSWMMVAADEAIRSVKGQPTGQLLKQHQAGSYPTGVLKRRSPGGQPFRPLAESTIALRKWKERNKDVLKTRPGVAGLREGVFNVPPSYRARGRAFILRETSKKIMASESEGGLKVTGLIKAGKHGLRVAVGYGDKDKGELALKHHHGFTAGLPYTRQIGELEKTAQVTGVPSPYLYRARADKDVPGPSPKPRVWEHEQMAARYRRAAEERKGTKGARKLLMKANALEGAIKEVARTGTIKQATLDRLKARRLGLRGLKSGLPFFVYLGKISKRFELKQRIPADFRYPGGIAQPVSAGAATRKVVALSEKERDKFIKYARIAMEPLRELHSMFYAKRLKSPTISRTFLSKKGKGTMETLKGIYADKSLSRRQRAKARLLLKKFKTGEYRQWGKAAIKSKYEFAPSYDEKINVPPRPFLGISIDLETNLLRLVNIWHLTSFKDRKTKFALRRIR